LRGRDRGEWRGFRNAAFNNKGRAGQTAGDRGRGRRLGAHSRNKRIGKKRKMALDGIKEEKKRTEVQHCQPRTELHDGIKLNPKPLSEPKIATGTTRSQASMTTKLPEAKPTRKNLERDAEKGH